MSARGPWRSMHRRCVGVIAATAIGSSACGPTIVGDPVGGPRAVGSEWVADLGVTGGDPAGFEVDPTVTLHDAEFAAVTLDEGSWVISLRVRNDDGVSREIKLPDNGGPRFERTDGGLRVSWLRGRVESSDPETGEVSFARGRRGADLVAVSRRQEFMLEDRAFLGAALAPYRRFELCLEVLPPSAPDTPAAGLRTGERTMAAAGYAGGETVLLACGPATRGEDVQHLERSPQF